MSVQLDQLQASVANETTVEQSAIALLNGLSQQLKDAGTDPAKIQDIITQIDSNSTNLAAAVAANTPAAPAPTA